MHIQTQNVQQWNVHGQSTGSKEKPNNVVFQVDKIATESMQIFIIINKRADKRHRVRTRKMHLKINNKREWIKTSSIPKKMLFKETKNIISNTEGINNKKNCFFKSWLSQIFFIFLGFFYFDFYLVSLFFFLLRYI